MLDTNIVIAALNGESSLWDRFAQAEQIFLSTIVLGELFFGAEKSAQPERNRERVERITVGRLIVGCDVETARTYGTLRQQLRAKGRPIPDNDIWIAATALRHDLTFATRDQHFHALEALPLASW